MIPLAAGALGVGLAGAGAKWWSGLGASGQMRRETREQVRRFEAQAARQVSTATALGAASGVTFDSSSLQLYLQDMTAEFRRQADWMRSSGMRQADAMATQATLGFAGDVAGSLFSYGQANNWWMTPAAPAGGGAAPLYRGLDTSSMQLRPGALLGG